MGRVLSYTAVEVVISSATLSQHSRCTRPGSVQTTLTLESRRNASITHLSGVDVRALTVDVGVVFQEDSDSRVGGSRNGLTSIASGHNMGDLAVLADNAKAQHLRRGPLLM